jgi:type IV secretory pathway VirJ component
MIVILQIKNNHQSFSLRKILCFLLFALILLQSNNGQTGEIRGKKIENIPYNVTGEKTAISSTPVALIISGDGGWFYFEQHISDRLAAYGVPVIGIDIRKYFWNRKTPEICASDMAEVLNFYAKEWGKKRFIIIGYSQGAEIVPFLLTHFPDSLKSRVLSAIMLSPDVTTDFEVHVTNMLGLGSRQNTYNVIEEIKKMPKINAICIFGDSENTPVPELLKATSVKVIFIPGDHHYKGNSAIIVQTMKENHAF